MVKIVDYKLSENQGGKEFRRMWEHDGTYCCHLQDGRKYIFCEKHWKTLAVWANYLSKEGLDPALQLSTDDFAGHLARNANLSMKAIVALGGYVQMAEKAGEQQTAAKYRSITKEIATRWMAMAADGDHYSFFNF